MFGKIIDMEDNYVIIENASHKLEVNYVNYHVIFPENNRGIVAEIVSMNENIIKTFLVGEIRNNVFYPGVMRKPNFTTVPRLIYKSEIELLLGSQDKDNVDSLYIGKSVNYEGFNVSTDVNAFFANHFAIIGNTGAGKSCGVARVLQNIFFRENEKMPINAHVVMFDVYGEYNSALSSINNLPNMGYKYLTTDTSDNPDNIVNIPAYFLEVDDLALLLNVDNAGELPILEKTLKYVYIFKGQNATMINYKNGIIAVAILELLSSGRASTQIRDQIIAILTQYNTKDINLQTPIVQPGYVRTIKQCLNIDSQGKLNAVQYLVDYLEKFQKLDISTLEVDRNIVYSLDDLYYALEFALISEGALKSEKIYDEYSKLKTRLHQIINSDYKKFFAPGERKISKAEYIQNLFMSNNGRVQIVNMNLNYIDDRFAKVLTKIYAKMFFDFTTNLRERASFPIHIILEEAYRYVQNDNDINVLGYNIFDRITKEGRKYGVIMGLITQRPSELSTTALSQCSNFIVFRMFHPNDLKIIGSITSNVNSETVEKIKNLTSGTAMVFGLAFKLPLIVKLDIPNPMPKSTSLDVKNTWFLVNRN